MTVLGWVLTGLGVFVILSTGLAMGRRLESPETSRSAIIIGLVLMSIGMVILFCNMK